MLTKIKTWFLGLKTWQKVVVGFVAFSFLVAPFSGETSSDAGGTETPAPTIAPVPNPTIAEMPSDDMLIEKAGCENIAEGISNAASSGLDWSNSIITDDEYIKVLEDKVIPYVGVAYLYTENAEALDWLSSNIELLQQARVTLVETFNYDKVGHLLAKAILDLDEGFDVYCSGYLQ
jgi:hypothetical protein